MPHADRPRYRTRALAGVAGCLGALALGCSLPMAIVKAPIAAVHSGTPPRLVVTVAPDANQNSPLAVDLVLVRDSNLLKTLAKVQVSDWFRDRGTWEMDNPKHLQVMSWEWAPGQRVAPIPLDLPGGLKGGLLFVSYPTPGAKPVPVDPSHGIVLDLLTSNFAARPAG